MQTFFSDSDLNIFSDKDPVLKKSMDPGFPKGRGMFQSEQTDPRFL